MGYLPDSFPTVAPNLDDMGFWENCNARRLAFQRCEPCGRFRHPPTPYCPHCQSSSWLWSDAPTVGRIFTFTVVHHPGHPAAASAVPYNVVLVEFPECGGVRLVSNVLDGGEDLSIGSAVELAWDEGSGGQILPRFRLAKGG